jgi:hypothetical protein
MVKQITPLPRDSRLRRTAEKHGVGISIKVTVQAVRLQVTGFGPKGKTAVKAMNTTRIVKVFYCGIEVELTCRMDHCSLVRFNERSFVVDTADLVLPQNFKKVAARANNAWTA